MSWSCEKFKMEDGDDRPANNSQYVIAIGLANGIIVVMRNYEDFANMEFHTGLYPICLEWSNSGGLLCVAGSRQRDSGEYSNVIKIYSIAGVTLYSTPIPCTQFPVTALTWGHNDRRIFVATGPEVHIAWVSTRISSLQLICSLQIYKEIAAGAKQTVAQLPLPSRIQQIISKLFMHTIRCPVPIGSNVRDFVSRATRHRLHCTMLRHDDNEYYITPAVYTLYLEYFGGLVPLLKGKRISKIKPDFVIYDPQVSDKVIHQLEASASGLSTSTSSKPHPDPRDDSDADEGCASPRLRRKRTPKPSDHALINMNYVDTLPEESKLAQVVSNLWGTKFRIVSTNVQLPHELGQIIYKTSLLHLQPRQMTLVVTGDNNTHQLDDGEPMKGGKESPESMQNIGDDDEMPPPGGLPPTAPAVAPLTKSRCKFQTGRKVQSPVDSPPAKPYCEIVGDKPSPHTTGECSVEPVVADIKINRQVVRSCSAGYLDLVETDNVRRTNRVVRLTPQASSANKTLLSKCGKSRSLDSSDIKNLIDNISFHPSQKIEASRNIYSAPSSPALKKKSTPSHKKCTNVIDASIKCLLNSPMLQRRRKNNTSGGSSRGGGGAVFSDERTPLDNYETDYKNLETFQKYQMKKKMSVSTERREFRNNMLYRKEFIMQNKAPMWNETSQVYQLDFGGRVTQESAKNFQVEFRGKQVMQFGRIDYNAYTLDFQYPFSAVQAFAVALANITQRLK
uniref:Tubby-related protein 4 n=1 Tax=Cacopsylla melanoneura TaxID=428564 RepID=A0A8D8VT80_9HEMI